MEPSISSRISQCLENYNKISQASDENYLYVNEENNLEIQNADQKSIAGSFWTSASKTVTNLGSTYTGIKSDWQSVAARIDDLNQEVLSILKGLEKYPPNEKDKKNLQALRENLESAGNGLGNLATKYEKEAGGWFGEKASKRKASSRFNNQSHLVQELRQKITNYLKKEEEPEERQNLSKTAFGLLSEFRLPDEEITSDSPDGEGFTLIGEQEGDVANMALDQSIASNLDRGKVKQVWIKSNRDLNYVYYTPLTAGAEKELKEEVELDAAILANLKEKFPDVEEFHLAVDPKEVPEEKRIKNPETSKPMYTVQCKRADDNLEKYMAKDLSLSERLEIGAQVLTGLNYLHQAGYIQGDLKPENMLVFNTKSQAEDRVVRIADFGKAVAIDPKKIKAMRGNPRFSPPENATTKEGEVYGAALILIRTLEEDFLKDEKNTLVPVEKKKETASKIRRGIEKYVVEHPDCYQVDQWVSLGGLFKTAQNYMPRQKQASLKAAEEAVHSYIDAFGKALSTKLPYNEVEALTALLKEMTSSDPAIRPTMEEAEKRYKAIADIT